MSFSFAVGILISIFSPPFSHLHLLRQDDMTNLNGKEANLKLLRVFFLSISNSSMPITGHLKGSYKCRKVESLHLED